MAARLFSLDGSAKGTAESNSIPVDSFRRRIFPPPYGGLRRIAERLGRRERWVYDQAEGIDPLTLTLSLEVLAEHTADVTEGACAELLAPLGLAVTRRQDVVHAGCAISAHGQLLAGLAALENEFAAALGNDGRIDAREAARLGAICGELRARVAALDAQLSGGDK